ncbi:ABC-2 type transport system permease protein [Oikeobacillus pervagus]|uniref:ABC-2 type transport system permease protein n=1 Tax=Oikeobacillus pervagus TaxID=1325931 RepID=A0AAJ1SXB9_9BACI|nr:ABC transporter permease [Oikeobacillus pervagus]MDQ0214523.1 ABC-2 type transport system permease protein [Oikeobacillus pervagus]
MTFSIKRSLAIFHKDYKDVCKNLYVTVSVMMPLVLAAMWGMQGIKDINMHYMLFNGTLCMVAAYVQCCLIAEEKEKNTLRGLMLSPASTMDILVGKSLLSIVATFIILVACAFLQNYKPENLLVISIAMALTTIFYIGLGTVLGLVTKSIMEASVIILPFIAFFCLGSFLQSLAKSFPIMKFAEYLPNVQLIEIANQVHHSGAGLADVWFNLVVILTSIIVIFAIAVVIFRKRMMD